MSFWSKLGHLFSGHGFSDFLKKADELAHKVEAKTAEEFHKALPIVQQVGAVVEGVGTIVLGPNSALLTNLGDFVSKATGIAELGSQFVDANQNADLDTLRKNAAAFVLAHTHSGDVTKITNETNYAIEKAVAVLKLLGNTSLAASK